MANSDETSNEERKEGGEGISSRQRGKIIITRCPHDSIQNASIATVNALQEPGAITAFLPICGSGRPFLRIPHLIDVLSMLDRMNLPKRIHNETTQPHIYLRGTKSEAEWFFKVRPTLFFVNCFVMSGIDQNGIPKPKSSIYKLFPVILKQDTYYLIIGEEGTPVYRILSPQNLFFTMEGKTALKNILSTNHRRHDERLEFYENESGVLEAYCVPNIQHELDKWDNCTVTEMEDYINCPLVNEPIVPAGFKNSVQIIDLEDEENIVDLGLGHHRFPIVI